MAFVEKRKRGTWVGFIIDMHAQESTTSWMRWMGTLILTNIMLMWTLTCLFDADWKFNLSLEEMPLGLLGIVTTVIGGKVLQSMTEKNKNTTGNQEGQA
jgi:uncharacterized membrane protein